MGDLLKDWMRLDGRIKAFDADFAELARTDEAMRRLATVPGHRAGRRDGAGGAAGGLRFCTGHGRRPSR